MSFSYCCPATVPLLFASLVSLSWWTGWFTSSMIHCKGTAQCRSPTLGCGRGQCCLISERNGCNASRLLISNYLERSRGEESVDRLGSLPSFWAVIKRAGMFSESCSADSLLPLHTTLCAASTFMEQTSAVVCWGSSITAREDIEIWN